jgi:hypothetical protein
MAYYSGDALFDLESGGQVSLRYFSLLHRCKHRRESYFPEGVIDENSSQEENISRVKKYIQENPKFKFDVKLEWRYFQPHESFAVEIPFMNHGEYDGMFFRFPLTQAYHHLNQLLGGSRMFRMPSEETCAIEYSLSGTSTPSWMGMRAPSPVPRLYREEMEKILQEKVLKCLYRPCMKPETKDELTKAVTKREFSRIHRTLSKRGKPSLDADTQRHVLSYVGGRTRRSVSRQKGKGKSRRRSRSATEQ